MGVSAAPDRRSEAGKRNLLASDARQPGVCDPQIAGPVSRLSRLSTNIGCAVIWSEWLIDTGIISPEQLADASRLASLRSMSLPDAMFALEYADRWAITQAFSVQHGSPLVDFYNERPTEDVIRSVPVTLVRDFEVCPVAMIDSILWDATPHLGDTDHRSRLSWILNRDVRPMWAPRDWVHQMGHAYHTAWHSTSFGSAWAFARFGEEDWLLLAGNRYREYLHTLPCRQSRGTRTGCGPT